MPIAAVAVLTTAVLAGIILSQDRKDSVIKDRTSEIACLQDSINTLNAQLETVMGAKPAASSQSDGFKYVVVKGDSFWSISKRFYHTGTRYEEVAAANGLDINAKLNVGDTLIIKQ